MHGIIHTDVYRVHLKIPLFCLHFVLGLCGKGFGLVGIWFNVCSTLYDCLRKSTIGVLVNLWIPLVIFMPS